jgi:hypothetical protein
MDTGNLAFIAVAFVISFFVVMTILWPLLESKIQAPPALDFLKNYDRLLYERERILENLTDLELDRNLKKIEEADYQALRAQLLSEAATIYRNIEELEKNQPLFKAIEKDLAESQS